MQKPMTLLWILFCVLCLVACGQSESDSPTIQYPYVQEYIEGQGNIKGKVPIEEYTAISEDFAIGADKDGYAVFKDPEKALAMLLELYSDGIDLIQTEFNLEPLSYDTYDLYKEFAFRITAGKSRGTAEEQEQIKFIGKFIDIYENSYTRQ